MLLQGFAAMAPLSGSDALHYHFAVPLLILNEGFHPNWFLSHSFFTGLSHQLILAALAAGSERLALGWIYLGGAVASLAGAHLARQWLSGIWPWCAALAFLLTPVTFWQITTAGAPDIWMACFVTLGVLSVVRAKECPRLAATVFGGVMAGAVAGTKYTGLILAACLFAAFIWEVRCFRRAIIFFLSAAITGCWLYVRNWVWSGDPVFPFLMRHLEPSRVNAYALAGYLADTGASAPRGLWQIMRFPLFAAVGVAHLDFSDFLGPLSSLLCPADVLRSSQDASLACGTHSVARRSCGNRPHFRHDAFLLPLLPIALAASMVGIAQLRGRRWRAVRVAAIVSFACSLLFGLGGLALYERNSLAVSAGLISRERYLRDMRPIMFAQSSSTTIFAEAIVEVAP